MNSMRCLILPLGLLALVLAGCGGGDGGAPNWSAGSSSLTGRWVLTARSVDQVAQDLTAAVIIQIGADGAYQRWEGTVDNWTRGIILTDGGKIQVQATGVHSAQASADTWQGTFSIADDRLSITRTTDAHSTLETYDRLQPIPPSSGVGNWLWVAAVVSGVPTEVTEPVVTAVAADGTYHSNWQDSGGVEAGIVEFSIHGDRVTTVQSVAPTSPPIGSIIAASYTLANGVMQVRNALAPHDQQSLAQETGALDSSLRGAWLLTEVVDQGLHSDAPLGASAMRLTLADRSGSLLWWNAATPSGQTAGMSATSYSGGYVLLRRTTGVWPSSAGSAGARPIVVSLSQLASHPDFAGQSSLRNGLLWLGRGGLSPSRPLDGFADIWSKLDGDIPSELVRIWTLRSRSIGGVPQAVGIETLEVRADRTAVRTSGDPASTRSSYLETFAHAALTEHVYSSAVPAEIGQYSAAHYTVSGSQLTLISVDAQGASRFEVWQSQ